MPFLFLYHSPTLTKAYPSPDIKHTHTEQRTPQSSNRYLHSGQAKHPKRGKKIAPCKTQRSKPQRRGKKQPVLVSEASSTGRASNQYCLTMVTSTGSSCDQYWLLSPYRESPSDSRATPRLLRYTTPLFIGFANEAR